MSLSLDPEYHARLIQNKDQFCRAAGVGEHYLMQSMSPDCSQAERDYVTNYSKHSKTNVSGFVYSGSLALHRMSLMVGAFLRNHVDARIVTMSKIASMQLTPSEAAASVLVIPDFFVGAKEGSHIPDWQKSGVLSLLISRKAANKQTVVYVSNMVELGSSYGKPFQSLFDSYLKD